MTLESLGTNSRQAGLTEGACRSPTHLTDASANSRAVFNMYAKARGLQWFKRGPLVRLVRPKVELYEDTGD